MSIGTRLKQARKAAGLTQIELQVKCGLSQSALSDLENGKSSGSTSVAALASALGVNALWLESGRGAMYPGAAGVTESGGVLAVSPSFEEDLEKDLELLITYRRTNEQGRALIDALIQKLRTAIEQEERRGNQG